MPTVFPYERCDLQVTDIIVNRRSRCKCFFNSSQKVYKQANQSKEWHPLIKGGNISRRHPAENQPAGFNDGFIKDIVCKRHTMLLRN